MKDWRIAVAAVVATTVIIGTAQAITDTVFQYSPPKTGYFGLSPMAFAPADSTTANSYNNVAPNSVTAGAGGCFSAAVNLPQGAAINQFVAWFSAIGSQVNEYRIYRTRVTDGAADTIAFINATGLGGGTGTRTQTGVNVANTPTAMVNNALYLYGASICVGNGNTSFHGARIRYTFTNAGD
jgi:hypothetical protein